MWTSEFEFLIIISSSDVLYIFTSERYVKPIEFKLLIAVFSIQLQPLKCYLNSVTFNCHGVWKALHK